MRARSLSGARGISFVVTWVTLAALGRGAAEAGPMLVLDQAPIVFRAAPFSIEPDIGAAPGQLQYGYYAVSNPGDADLVMTSIAFTGPGAAAVTFDGDNDPECGGGSACAQPLTVPPNQTRFFFVHCTAPQFGAVDASLQIASNAVNVGGGTAVAGVTCLGLRPPVIEVTPAALDFGTTHWCEPLWDACFDSRCATRPLTQTVTIRNAAAPPSRLGFRITPTLTGGDPVFFTSAPELCDGDYDCHLGAGESITYELTFRPRRITTFDAPLQLTSDYAGQAPVDIPFFARAGAGALTYVDPLDLGTGPIGQTFTAPITVQNTGTSCIDVYRPVSDLAPTIDIAATDPPVIELLAGESYTWTASCTPPAAGTTYATLTHETRAWGSSYQWQLVSCTGTALAAEPAVLAFVGADEVATGASRTLRVTVRNVGDGATDLVSIGLPALPLTAAVVGASLPVTLAPGAAVDVDFTFAPVQPGAFTGQIQLGASTGADLALPVSADAVVLGAAVTPAAHDFGAVALPAAPSQAFELRNTGTRRITVTGVALDPPADFAVAGLAAGLALEPGAAHTFTVQTTPAALGARRATLAIALDRAAPVEVPLAVLATAPGGCAAAGGPAGGGALGAMLLLALRRRRPRRGRTGAWIPIG